jgi:hypothetical protein
MSQPKKREIKPKGKKAVATRKRARKPTARASTHPLVPETARQRQERLRWLDEYVPFKLKGPPLTTEEIEESIRTGGL